MAPHAYESEVSSGGAFESPVIHAYAEAMGFDHRTISPVMCDAIMRSKIAHAYTDAEAATQAGLSQEEMAHDRAALDATDGLPLIITAKATHGRYYFSRPAKGWPRPGHRRYR